MKSRRAEGFSFKKLAALVLLIFALLFSGPVLGKIKNAAEGGLSDITANQEEYFEIFGDKFVLSQEEANDEVTSVSDEDKKKIRELSRECKQTEFDDLTQEELSLIEQIAAERGATTINLLKVMAFESGHTFCPCALNEKSYAVGLIQFVPSTAKGLGTSSLELCQMSREEQLVFVQKYLAQSAKEEQLDSLEKLYASVLCPGAFKSGIVASKEGNKGACEGKNKEAYANNEGLDKDEDEVITIAEASLKVEEATTYIS